MDVISILVSNEAWELEFTEQISRKGTIFERTCAIIISSKSYDVTEGSIDSLIFRHRYNKRKYLYL